MQVATIRIGKVENGYLLNVSMPRQSLLRFVLRPVKKIWVAKNRDELGTVLQSIAVSVVPAKEVKEEGAKNKRKAGD